MTTKHAQFLFTVGAILGTSAIAGSATVACSSSTCVDDGNCDSPRADGGGGNGDGQGPNGGDTGTPDVVAPPGCDATAEPKDAPKCVVSEYGVFVDGANGSDTAAGTKEAPVKSITTALTKLAGKPRIYVCEGTYPEHVKLTTAVSVYGGFACSGWNHTGTKPSVTPADVGYALEVTNVATDFVIADMSFTSLAGTAAAPSSIAAFVATSPKLKLVRVALKANDGANGANQVKAANGMLQTSTPTAGTLNGNAGGAVMGGLAQLCTCVGGGTSKGGGGGNMNSGGENGETAQAVPDPATATGQGQTAMTCNQSGLPPRPGSNAPNAAAAEGAKTRGVLTSAGWVSEAGKAGSLGVAGQGGGGGGGDNGGGGGGACGGCGGAGGLGGGGGGASVALVTFESAIALTGCALTSGKAGNGGTGGVGGDGANGGTKGARGGAACDGANGGKGGNGGAGGGGAGGVAAAILSKGGKPNNDQATTMAAGGKGTPGIGGAAGTNDGIDGDSQNVIELP